MSKLVRTFQEALDILDDYRSLKPKRVAVDTETTGLHWPSDRLFLIQVGWGWESNYAFPASMARIVSQIIEDPSSEKVFHNAKFDMHFLEQAGICVAGKIHDTQVMARLLLPQNHRGKRISLSLTDLASALIDPNADQAELELKRWMAQEKRRRSRELTARLREAGMTRKEYDQLVKQGLPLPKHIQDIADSINLNPTYDDVPHEIMEPYATGDVKYTLALYNRFMPLIESNQLTSVYERDMRTLLYAYNWEKTGMRVDFDHLKKGIEYGEKMLRHIQQEAHEHIGRPINLNSNEQILELLKERGFELTSTDSETLSAIKDKEPVASIVLKHRDYSKEIGTYYKPIYDKASRAFDKRLHGSFNVAGPVTGRFSSSDPNLQNMPREPLDEVVGIRRAFIPTDGYVLVYMDFNQMEVRVMAEYSQDTNLCEAILNGEDLHTKTALTIDPRAKELYIPGLPKDQQPKEFQKIRSAAKQTTFGIFYGMGPKKLAQQIKVDVETARMYIDNFFKLYPGVKRFIDMVQYVASNRPGRYVVNKFGRVYWGEAGREYALVDYLIQGTCADLMKEAIHRCEQVLRGKKSRLISMVHDELIAEIAYDELDLVPVLIQQMSTWPDFKIPMRVDAEYTLTNWAETKPWKGKEAVLAELSALTA